MTISHECDFRSHICNFVFQNLIVTDLLLYISQMWLYILQLQLYSSLMWLCISQVCLKISHLQLYISQLELNNSPMWLSNKHNFILCLWIYCIFISFYNCNFVTNPILYLKMLLYISQLQFSHIVILSCNCNFALKSGFVCQTFFFS